ncbi:MAG: hypothetical protein ACW96U_09815 [Candidatus Heimdallarchaeaceae archaeon]
MAKSRKKKSSKKKGSGKALGALALIISLGAMVFSLYQFFVPSGGPIIYSLLYDDPIILDGISSIDYLSELELTYSAQAGDRVLFEFNCEIFVSPIGGTDLSLHFDINYAIFPTTRIYVYTESYLYTTSFMRHYIESSEAGEFTVYIYADISDESTGSYIRRCFITVTVY